MEPFSIIDTVMHGYPQVTAAFVVAAEKVALVETGPKSRVDNVFAELDSLGIDRLDWIVVTHIHLDHAGAAGTVAQKFPDARVAVHGVGAPHLADPTKLWSSAARIYGDRMEEMWGGIDPIDPGRITVLEDGDAVDLGGRSLKAIETPGHAYHHHAYLDSTTGTLFTGDAIGVRLPGVALIRPATPPPEFHLEKAIASIERIRAVDPQRLCPTHFGPVDGGVDETCSAAIESLLLWSRFVQEARRETDQLDTAAKIVEERARDDLKDRLDEDSITRLEQTTSFWMNTWGYMRYFDKLQEAVQGDAK